MFVFDPVRTVNWIRLFLQLDRMAVKNSNAASEQGSISSFWTFYYDSTQKETFEQVTKSPLGFILSNNKCRAVSRVAVHV